MSSTLETLALLLVIYVSKAWSVILGALLMSMSM